MAPATYPEASEVGTGAIRSDGIEAVCLAGFVDSARMTEAMVVVSAGHAVNG